MEKIFFELIRVAIGNAVCLSQTPTDGEWQMLYDMAKKQTIHGVCFYGVQCLKSQGQCPPKQLYNQWKVAALYIKQRNEIVNQQCVDLQKRLSADGMQSSILKGQGVATLYKISGDGMEVSDLSMLRQSGDIDIYVPGGMDNVMTWCNEKYGKVAYDYINAHVPVYKDTEVEVHWRVQTFANLFANRNLQKWLKENEDKIVGRRVDLSDGSSITVPSAEFNAFYILLHIYNHVLGEGLGLRQLLDYYFVLRTKFDKKIVLNLLDEFCMMKFAKGIMWIMHEIFGLQKEYLLCEPNERAGLFILDEIMIGGNFGHHDKRTVKMTNNRKWQSIWSQLQHAVRMARFAPSNVFWQPVWVLYHFVWKRTSARKWL